MFISALLASVSLAGNPEVPISTDFDLNQEVVWRRVELDRWRFEPVFVGEPRSLVAILAWRSRSTDKRLGDVGGHDFTAMLYLIDEAGRNLPIEDFESVEVWPQLPTSVGWIERSAWADDLTQTIFVMDIGAVQEYTKLLSGMYVVPGFEDLAPSVAAFPVEGDPLFNAADGDEVVAERALAQIVEFFRLPTEHPSTGDLRRERFDALDSIFIEVLPTPDWALKKRHDPVGDTCVCEYARRVNRLYYRASVDTSSFRYGGFTGAFWEWKNKHGEIPVVRESTKTSIHKHKINAAEACPDGTEVPELIALQKHKATLHRRGRE